MIIDNKLQTAKLRMTFLLLVLVGFTCMGYVWLEGGIYRNMINTVTFYAGIACFAVYIFMHLLNLSYFYFDDRNAKIIIRYYQAHPYIRRYRAIEIPKSKLSRYDISSSLGGLRKHIVFYVQTPKGEVAYPPVSLSAVSSAEISRLQQALSSLLQQNISNN